MAGNSFAFPQRWSRDTAAFTDEDRGMTLRDWFAGQALSGYCTNTTHEFGSAEIQSILALRSYAIADAMLFARAALQSKEGE